MGNDCKASDTTSVKGDSGMSDPEVFKLNGHDSEGDVAIESEIVKMQGVVKDLDDFKRGDGILVRGTKEQLSLLNKMLSAPDNTEDRFTLALSRANFLDETEMRIHILAYAEAIELGMTTEFNIQMLEGLRGTNRKGGFKSNLVAALLDGLSHQKYTANVPREKNGNTNSRSPIA
jgi:hypothetical protein